MEEQFDIGGIVSGVLADLGRNDALTLGDLDRLRALYTARAATLQRALLTTNDPVGRAEYESQLAAAKAFVVATDRESDLLATLVEHSLEEGVVGLKR